MEIKYIKKGFSLVELIIAIGVFAIVGSGVFYVITNTYSNYYGTGDRQTVTEFAQEGVEAVRAIRDNSWQDIEDEIDNTNGVSKDANNYWQFSGGSDSLGSLTRTIDITEVYRDGSGDIAETGTLDTDTVKAVITVSGFGMDDYVLTTYISNWSIAEWEQDDWSGIGDSNFWNANNLASSSVSNIVTSTSNEISIARVEAGFNEWNNLSELASSTMGGVVYDFDFSSDNETIYVVGDTSHDIRAYDISDIRSGNIFHSWTLDLSSSMSGGLSIAVNPNDSYAYIGASFSYTGFHTIAIVKLGSPQAVSYVSTGLSYGRINDLVIDSSGNYLYALGGYGRLYIFSIGSSGSTLTLENGGEYMTSCIRLPICPSLNKGYLNTTEEYFYVSTDDSNNSLMKVDITDEKDARISYSFSDIYDFVDVNYIDTVLGNPSFIVATENRNEEFRIIKDTITSNSFSELDIYDLGGSSVYSAVYDSSDIGLTFDYQGNIYSLDISDKKNIDVGPVSDTSSYGFSPTSAPYNFMKYNDTLGGLFMLEKKTSPTSYVLNFIEKPIDYEYASTGSLTSSIYDIGSSDKELHSITINQNIPIGCEIEITLQGSNDDSFASLTSNVFSNNSVSTFTSTTPTTLNNKRYLRYIADLTSCNSGADTPTLYSVKLRYK